MLAIFIFPVVTSLLVAVGAFLLGRASKQTKEFEQDDEFLEVLEDMEETHKREIQSVFDSLNHKFTNQLNDFKSNIGNVLATLKTTDAQVLGKINLLKKYFDLEEYTRVEISDSQGMVQEGGLREVPATLTPRKHK